MGGVHQRKHTQQVHLLKVQFLFIYQFLLVVSLLKMQFGYLRIRFGVKE
jgi:hypothetical protein